MNRPVDVLAVMDDAAHKLAHGVGMPAAQMAVAAELREARAAVAELVEAARYALLELNAAQSPETVADLRAALAKFGGQP